MCFTFLGSACYEKKSVEIVCGVGAHGQGSAPNPPPPTPKKKITEQLKT